MSVHVCIISVHNDRLLGALVVIISVMVHSISMRVALCLKLEGELHALELDLKLGLELHVGRSTGGVLGSSPPPRGVMAPQPPKITTYPLALQDGNYCTRTQRTCYVSISAALRTSPSFRHCRQ